VTEQLYDHTRVDVLAQQERRGGESPVVQADLADAGGAEQGGPVVKVVFRCRTGCAWRELPEEFGP
jgi:transposase